MSRYQKNLGDFGEKTAEEYLKQKGLVILARNYTVPGGELDLVAETETHLVFVEVKTRSGLGYGHPIEAIDRRKMMHMRRAAERYLMAHPTQKEVRFDAVEVYAAFRGNAFCLEKIQHFPDILLEGDSHYETNDF